jgi:transcriptional regulator with XRE-family HTH domain
MMRPLAVIARELLMTSAAPIEQRDEIRSVLRGLRQRLNSTTTLGEYDRIESRRGRPVSQAEIAEAVGVSLGWYQRLESGDIRPSISLLNRIAVALNATPDERATLFRLAVPALADVFTTRTAETFESLSFVRAVSSRLWAANSESEALTIAGEHLATWFADASLIVSVKRLHAGRWKCLFGVDRGHGTAWSRCVAEIGGLTTPRQIDEFWSFPRLQSPGETIDDSEHEQLAPDLRRLTMETHKKHGLNVPSFLRSRITARCGLIAGIQVNHRKGYTYSETDRAALAVVAELTSLTLS